MFRPAKQTWLRVMVSVALAMPTFSWAGGGGDCWQPLVEQCNNNLTSTMGGVQSGMSANRIAGGQSTQNILNADSEVQGNGAQTLGSQAGQCADSAAQCKKLCKKPEEQKQCKEAVQQAAEGMQTQSQNLQQASSGNSSAAGALMGALGGIAGALLAKAMEKKKQPPPPPPVYGALQPNGGLNCQMADSFNYADCDTFLTQYCANQASSAGAMSGPQMTGTVISTTGGIGATPDCNSFNARYCSTTQTPPTAMGNQLPNGNITAVNIAGSGEGLTSPYCQGVVGNQWCAESPARAVCPTCRRMMVGQSPACAQNPALCLIQSGPEDAMVAQQNPACAGDPLYSAGSPYMPGGVIAGTGGGVPLTGGGGIPAVVVPQSSQNISGGKPVTTSTLAQGGTGGNGTATILPQSVHGPGSMGAAKEGTSHATAGGANFGGANISLSRGISGSAATSRELVAAGGVIVSESRNPASSGPASDINSRFGPSVFVTQSAVIQQHCNSGKLNCR